MDWYTIGVSPDIVKFCFDYLNNDKRVIAITKRKKNIISFACDKTETCLCVVNDINNAMKRMANCG